MEDKPIIFFPQIIRKKESNHKTKKELRNNYFKIKYNITSDDYDRMFKEQDGCCAICGKHQSENQSRKGRDIPLFIDHDHITGKIRGLLCSNCNSVLGYAHDDKDILKNAIDYLSKY